MSVPRHETWGINIKILGMAKYLIISAGLAISESNLFTAVC